MGTSPVTYVQALCESWNLIEQKTDVRSPPYRAKNTRVTCVGFPDESVRVITLQKNTEGREKKWLRGETKHLDLNLTVKMIDEISGLQVDCLVSLWVLRLSKHSRRPTPATGVGILVIYEQQSKDDIKGLGAENSGRSKTDIFLVTFFASYRFTILPVLEYYQVF